MKWSLTLSTLALLSSMAMANDASEHQHHHEQDQDEEHKSSGQKPHVHGFAELTLVIEGGVLEISLDSPAANIVGFEHEARSEEQQATVRGAKSLLESPEQLFSFTGGNCTIEKAAAVMSALKQHTGHDHEEEHNDDAERHSEVTASYIYQCQHSKELKAISVDLLDRFPAIEILKTMWITEHKQGSTELDSKSKVLQLR